MDSELVIVVDGITSFSVKPIRLIINIGFVLSIVSFVYLVYVVVGQLNGADNVRGWASLAALLELLDNILHFVTFFCKLLESTSKFCRYLI